jgi:hypothetical protein
LFGGSRLSLAGYGEHEAFAALFRDPLAMYLEKNPTARVSVLVDGLDEALPYPSPTIVDLIADLLGILPDNFRMLVSYKNDAGLSRRFRMAFPDVQLIDLSDEGARERSQSDVRRYVRRELPDSGAVAAIARAAGDNFLVASSLVDEARSGGRVPFSHLPRSVGERYLQVCENLEEREGRAGGEWFSSEASLLGSLATAFAPVPAATLARWCGISEVALRKLLDRASQLVDHDVVNGVVRLRHSSLRSFFLAEVIEGTTTYNRFFLDERSQHQRIIEYYLDREPEHVDDYGVVHLAAHVERFSGLTGPSARSSDYIGALGRLLSSARFMRRARTRTRRCSPGRVLPDWALAASCGE